MKGLILAAGKGTRLKPVTHSIAKPLVPIANKPTIIYAIESFISAGIKQIGIVINEEYKSQLKDTISDYFKDADVQFECIIQTEQKGIAHAVKCARSFIAEDDFLLQLGDNIIFHDYQKFIHDNSRCKILLAPVEDITRYGIVEFQEGKIVNLIEKPKQSSSNLAMVGLYLFGNDIFEVIDELTPSARGEYEITDTIHNYLKKFSILDYDICNLWWKDTGTSNDILEANKFIIENVLKCENIVDASSVIEYSLVGSNVSIGKNCSIKGCSIKNSIIFDNVKISNIEVIDSIISNDCIIQNNGQKHMPLKAVLGSQSFITLM